MDNNQGQVDQEIAKLTSVVDKLGREFSILSRNVLTKVAYENTENSSLDHLGQKIVQESRTTKGKIDRLKDNTNTAVAQLKREMDALEKQFKNSKKETDKEDKKRVQELQKELETLEDEILKGNKDSERVKELEKQLSSLETEIGKFNEETQKRDQKESENRSAVFKQMAKQLDGNFESVRGNIGGLYKQATSSMEAIKGQIKNNLSHEAMKQMHKQSMTVLNALEEKGNQSVENKAMEMYHKDTLSSLEKISKQVEESLNNSKETSSTVGEIAGGGKEREKILNSLGENRDMLELNKKTLSDASYQLKEMGKYVDELKELKDVQAEIRRDRDERNIEAVQDKHAREELLHMLMNKIDGIKKGGGPNLDFSKLKGNDKKKGNSFLTDMLSNFLGNRMGTFLTGLLKRWLWAPVMGVLNTLFLDKLKTWFRKQKIGLRKWFRKNFTHPIRDFFKGIKKAVLDKVELFKKGVSEAFTKYVKDPLKNAFTNYIKDPISSAFTKYIKDPIKGAFQTYTGFFGSLWDRAGKAVTGVKNTVGGAVSATTNWVGEKATKVKDVAISGAKWVGKKASDAKKWVGDKALKPFAGYVTKKGPEFLGKALKIAAKPIMALIRPILAAFDISSIASNPELSVKEKKEQIGATVLSASGGALGMLLGQTVGGIITGLAAASSGVGAAIGPYIIPALGILGDILGSWVFGKLAGIGGFGEWVGGGVADLANLDLGGEKEDKKKAKADTSKTPKPKNIPDAVKGKKDGEKKKVKVDTPKSPAIPKTEMPKEDVVKPDTPKPKLPTEVANKTSSKEDVAALEKKKEEQKKLIALTKRDLENLEKRGPVTERSNAVDAHEEQLELVRESLEEREKQLADLEKMSPEEYKKQIEPTKVKPDTPKSPAIPKTEIPKEDVIKVDKPKTPEVPDDTKAMKSMGAIEEKKPTLGGIIKGIGEIKNILYKYLVGKRVEQTRIASPDTNTQQNVPMPKEVAKVEVKKPEQKQIDIEKLTKDFAVLRDKKIKEFRDLATPLYKEMFALNDKEVKTVEDHGRLAELKTKISDLVKPIKILTQKQSGFTAEEMQDFMAKNKVDEVEKESKKEGKQEDNKKQVKEVQEPAKKVAPKETNSLFKDEGEQLARKPIKLKKQVNVAQEELAKKVAPKEAKPKTKTTSIKMLNRNGFKTYYKNGVEVSEEDYRAEKENFLTPAMKEFREKVLKLKTASDAHDRLRLKVEEEYAKRGGGVKEVYDDALGDYNSERSDPKLYAEIVKEMGFDTEKRYSSIDESLQPYYQKIFDSTSNRTIARRRYDNLQRQVSYFLDSDDKPIGEVMDALPRLKDGGYNPSERAMPALLHANETVISDLTSPKGKMQLDSMSQSIADKMNAKQKKGQDYLGEVQQKPEDIIKNIVMPQIAKEKEIIQGYISKDKAIKDAFWKNRKSQSVGINSQNVIKKALPSVEQKERAPSMRMTDEQKLEMYKRKYEEKKAQGSKSGMRYWQRKIKGMEGNIRSKKLKAMPKKAMLMKKPGSVLSDIEKPKSMLSNLMDSVSGGLGSVTSSIGEGITNVKEKVSGAVTGVLGKASPLGGMASSLIGDIIGAQKVKEPTPLIESGKMKESVKPIAQSTIATEQKQTTDTGGAAAAAAVGAATFAIDEKINAIGSMVGQSGVGSQQMMGNIMNTLNMISSKLDQINDKSVYDDRMNKDTEVSYI
jgi:hypothetical protein